MASPFHFKKLTSPEKKWQRINDCFSVSHHYSSSLFIFFTYNPALAPFALLGTPSTSPYPSSYIFFLVFSFSALLPFHLLFLLNAPYVQVVSSRSAWTRGENRKRDKNYEPINGRTVAKRIRVGKMGVGKQCCTRVQNQQESIGLLNRLLLRSHHPLICLPCSACFASTLRFARSFARSVLSSWESGW